MWRSGEIGFRVLHEVEVLEGRGLPAIRQRDADRVPSSLDELETVVSERVSVRRELLPRTFEKPGRKPERHSGSGRERRGPRELCPFCSFILIKQLMNTIIMSLTAALLNGDIIDPEDEEDVDDDDP
ncbi:hypothetical protein DPX16_20004 [Anabarilius grahami]|uniref:Uncharacterized protein n=1 Tax=Anabarilius grahami TaxID=495550 RepID=A0A3N0XPN3_ANAGA|nr:hypothetical protein DPX16_20004 [Anabarilius grahami]